MTRQVVVTGVGAVTALGATADETWTRIVAGERGFRPITLFDPGDVRTRLVGEVARAPSEGDSRTSSFALAAAREAIADARLDPGRRRVGLVLGGTTAGMFETESFLTTLLDASGTPEGREAALGKMLSHPLSAPTDCLARALGPFARTRSLSSACSGGANALLVGALWLELGLVDAVVCGAADALCRVTVAGFNALGALDPEGARPFDARRRGLTLGEGAGVVVLERAGEASREPYCSLLGWATRAEAHHITNPEATGRAPYLALAAALERAGVTPAEVDYVNAHGTGTPLNDPMETRALARLFGDRLEEVAVSSQKGMIGHTLAAAGSIEAVLVALAISRGVLPPTGGLAEVDPECRLRHVLAAERSPVDVAVSSSFGFGGMDTALVLGAPDRAAPPRARRSVYVTGIAAVTPAGVLDARDLADLPSRTLDAAATSAAIPDGALDPDRARRLDRASRLATVACERALGARTSEDGVVLGIAFGAVDETAEFMRRLKDKGARLVRPADFPTLVPSSPAGYVSIYLGLGGPSLVVADLAASGECAFAQAWELVAGGEASRICAGAVEERSQIVEAVLGQLFGRPPSAARREGSVALVLEAEQGPRAIARIVAIEAFGDESPELPPPPRGAIVVSGHAPNEREEELLARAGWAACPRLSCAAAAGEHEALGGMAIAVAVAKVAAGAPAALFVGSARGRGYAGVVATIAPEAGP